VGRRAGGRDRLEAERLGGPEAQRPRGPEARRLRAEAVINSKGNRRPDDWLGCLEAGRALRARRTDGSENRPYPMPLCRDAVPSLPITAAGARSWLPKPEWLTPEKLMPRWLSPVTRYVPLTFALRTARGAVPTCCLFWSTEPLGLRASFYCSASSITRAMRAAAVPSP